MGEDASFQGSKIRPRRNPISSFFSAPRLLSRLVVASKGSGEFAESLTRSPTSTLEVMSVENSPENHPVFSEAKSLKKGKLGSRGSSLGLADVLLDVKPSSTLDRAMVALFGSQKKIHVPAQISAAAESPPPPSDFGVKSRRNSFHMGTPSSPAKISRPLVSSSSSDLSLHEMELLEDYTCVIFYGMNPRTTHIFDDCVIKTCSGDAKLQIPESRSDDGVFWQMIYPSEGFLSFCCGCGKKLGEGTDIYMYRGESAFCSSECRHEEMLLNGEADAEDVPENSNSGDVISSLVSFPSDTNVGR